MENYNTDIDNKEELFLEDESMSEQDVFLEDDFMSDKEAKVLKINDSDLGRKFTETVSENVDMMREAIQRSREERYEEMIREVEEQYGPVESPMDRLSR